MSDGITDVGRDESRDRAFHIFLDKLFVYLDKRGTLTRRRDVLYWAKEVDAVPPGYFVGSTLRLGDITQWLGALVNGDPNEWARFLFALADDRVEWKRFRSISPFSQQWVISIDSTKGEPVVGGDAAVFFQSLVVLGLRKDMDIDGAKQYLIAINPRTRRAEVVACVE
jgi:hypothetical protein